MPEKEPKVPLTLSKFFAIIATTLICLFILLVLIWLCTLMVRAIF